ncbi:F0F1 ATP synthase subunit B [Martelella alba]|uniref:ATP synthase subunit b n=1 Tax=Martelella alba TaxID=2590451 RepID=A0A506UD06_9HYPH|nr:F0F1 ATP synthase subunit B [Martelella alba]TPW31011.1 F0F1 ATP synthase subunit B [Martelella alba]
MEFDATFFAFVGLAIFVVAIVYLKVPAMMTKSLDGRAESIRTELAEAKRLREEAQHLLADYQRKRREAEQEAKGIISAAEREAASIKEEARQKTEDYIARRTVLSEQKIRQAESEALEAVRGAAVDLAVEAARSVLEKKSTDAVQAKLFAKSVEEVKARLN